MSPKSWFTIIVLAVVVGLVEATFLTLLPEPWRHARPVLAGAIILVLLDKPKGAILYSALAGFVLDLFAVGNAVFSTGRFVFITAGVYALAVLLFTNRSVYAATALVAAARFGDALWIYTAQFVGARLLHYDIRVIPFSSLFVTWIWDVCLVGASFVFLALFTRRFMVAVSQRKYYDGL